MPMDDDCTEEEKKILFRAEAIKLYLSLKSKKLSEEISLPLTTGSAYNQSLKAERNCAQDASWELRLASSIFYPLLDQGFERYVEIIKRVAETGEIDGV